MTDLAGGQGPEQGQGVMSDRSGLPGRERRGLLRAVLRVVLPGGDVNSAVGYHSNVKLRSSRVMLRRAAQAELTRHRLRLRFDEPLETMFEVDQGPARIKEIRQIARLGAAIFVLLIAVFTPMTMRLGVDRQFDLLRSALQAVSVPLVTLTGIMLVARVGVPALLRESVYTAGCCCYTLVTLAGSYFGPSGTAVIDSFVVILPVVGVLSFARQRFSHAVFFVLVSALGLLELLQLRAADVPESLRNYVMVFLLSAATPPLLGVYRLEYSGRRIWLLRLLQSLQMDDLASENVEISEQAKEALRASEERIRQAQKMEAVGQLTGGIAHDFNNLLTAVIGSLELLQQTGRLDDSGERFAAMALAGAQRGARLTGQLLAFSRRQILAPTNLAPAEVVAGIKDLLAGTLGETISLGISSGRSHWNLMADRNQLEMALLNLVINARDAIGLKGGRVDIDITDQTLSPDDADALNGERVLPGDYVSITVRDTGAGMTPEVLARATEPFFTTKPAGTGTGLGLSQTYGFARQSGGALLIESAVGAGTCVTILLPRASETPRLKPAARQVASPGQGESILVVDDNVLARETVSAALRNLGYRVTTAADAEEALAALELGAPADLLVTDVITGGAMNGVALALAARKQRAGLRVLFITGFSDREVLAQWPDLLDLLEKPFNLDDLARRVARALRPAAMDT